MLKLYQREGCPASAKVRRLLEQHGISYQAVPVPKLGSERSEVRGLEGLDNVEVPVLVDGARAIQGSDAIAEYVTQSQSTTFFGDPVYGLTKRLPKTKYGDAVSAVKAALATEGFGVLTEIDVRATLKKKLDADFRNYIILGACNPPLAHQALTAEPGIGLLLACNVVVTEEDDGTAVVSAIDPIKMFSVLNRPDIEPVAKDVRQKLVRVLAALA
jgi:uncharacterized protein (DUF302 family)/glutaredoxin